MQTRPVTAEVETPRPSSTVVLVRQGVDLPEVYMVKRHARASFGAAYAFPGGVLDRADSEVHAMCDGLSAESANRILEVGEGGLDYYSAAVRELFEESGVLLADTRLSRADLEQARLKLNDGSLAWDVLVGQNDIRMRCDQLHYVGFWITPREMAKRYSARFFLAQLPDGQRASHCGGEITDSCWISAPDVLAASKAGDMRVFYPTRKTLQSIADLDSVPAIRAWADSVAEAGVVCERPSFARGTC